MAKSIRRGHVRLQSYIGPDLAQRVDEFCAAKGVSESALVKSSISQYLAGTSDLTLVLRRLNKLTRFVERDHRDLELLSEAFGVYMRLWFAYMPQLPEDDKPAARASGESRYRQFVEYVCQQFSGSRRFLDDLPREILADEVELEAIAEGSNGGPADPKR